MRTFIRVIFIIIITVLSPTLSAQEHVYNTRFISTQNGLPNRTVLGISQDSDGFVYMLNSDMVLKYDGYTFQQLPAAIDGETNEVFLHAYDDRGMGPVFTSSAGNLFKISNDSVVYALKRPQDINPSYLSYYQTISGTHILFYSKARKILTFDDQWSRINEIECPGPWQLTRFDGLIAGTLHANYILTNDSTITMLSNDGDVLSHLHASDLGITEPIRAINNRGNALWVNTDSRLYTCDPANDLSIITETQFPHYSFIDPLAFNSTHFVIGGYTNNASIVQMQTGRNQQLVLDPIGYPISNPLHSGYTDNNNDIWIGCDVGVFVVHQDHNPFHIIDFDGNPSEPVNGMGVRAMRCLSDGTIFFNTDVTPFIELNQDGSIIKHIDNLGANFYSYYTLELEDQVLVSRNRSTMNLNTGQVYIAPYAGGFDRRAIDGSWWKTSGNDLLKTSAIDQPFTTVATFDARIQNIISIDSSILVTTATGIFVYDLSAQPSFIINNSEKANIKYTLNTPLCLSRDHNNNFWVGTTSGLLKIDTAKSTIEEFNIENGLPHNIIYSILPEGDSAIWLGTGNGLSRMSLHDNSLLNFNTTHGIAHNEFNRFATMIDSQGYYYMGGIDGITRFNPAEVLEYAEGSSTAEIVITSITRYNGEQLQQVPYEEIKSGDINFNANDRIFTCEVFLADYANPEANQFSWFLEGFDPAWSLPSNSNSIRYTDIPAGSYTLHIKARSSDGQWLRSTKSISLHVREVFYKTWWFMLICLFAMTSAVYAFSNYRFKRKLAMERMRTKIASDLHDEVGGLLSGMAMQMELIEIEAPDSMKTKLNRIVDTSRKAVSRMRDVIWVVDARRDTLGDLIGRLQVYAGEILEPLNIEYHFKIDVDENHNLPSEVREHLYYICKEALTNCAKHASASTVNIDFINNRNNLVVKIQDNGKGFSTTTDYDGQGLQNIAMRASIIGAAIAFTTDNGTCLKIHMPSSN